MASSAGLEPAASEVGTPRSSTELRGQPGAPGRTRTSDTRLRRPVLFSAELQARTRSRLRTRRPARPRGGVLVSGPDVMASPERFELPAPSVGGKCSIQLSYGDNPGVPGRTRICGLHLRRVALFQLSYGNKSGAPEGIRTPNLPIRSRGLCPVELQAQTRLLLLSRAAAAARKTGGRGWARTTDARLFRAALYQLSYPSELDFVPYPATEAGSGVAVMAPACFPPSRWRPRRDSNP